jgi:hypothetical protein
MPDLRATNFACTAHSPLCDATAAPTHATMAAESNAADRGGYAMRTAFACLVVLTSTGQAQAQAPPGAPPVIVQPELLPPVAYYRRSAYEVWQNLAVDRQGFFRARVILTPYETGFYRYNGEPFYWVTTQPWLYMPYASE